MLVEGGNVTVKDTSAEKTGKIDASLRADAIDVSGGATVSLENITVIGAFGSGDGIFVSGSANVTIKNCVLTAGKVGIDIISLSAVVIVEDSVFADFADYVTDKEKDERNAAIEFRNNAKIVLRGENEFKVNRIICRTENQEIPFAESFVLGDNVTIAFEPEDTDIGTFGENAYKANKITYVYEAPVETPDEPTGNETTDKSENKSDKESEKETSDEKQETSNPNTGDLMPYVIVVAAVTFAVTIIKKKAL